MSLAFVHEKNGKDPHAGAVWGVAWAATGAVVSISEDGTAALWDPASGEATRTRPAHPLGLVSLSLSADGQQALYNSVEGLTSLWDLTTGDVVGTSESYVVRAGHEAERSWSVSLHPQGGTYASTGHEGNVTIHSAAPETFGDLKATMRSGRHRFGYHCKHSPDGSKIAMATEMEKIYVFDTETSSLSSTSSAHAMTVRALAWSADSQLLVSASEDKRLVLHDLRAGKASTVAALAGHSSWVLCADMSPDGKLVLSGSGDRTIRVWDLAARAAVCTIRDTGEVWGAAWRPTPSAGGPGAAFVSGGEDGAVKWWRGAGAAA